MSRVSPPPAYGLISGYRRLADMIAENEFRADLSPWEKGRIVVESRDQGLFPTLDDAVARLGPRPQPPRPQPGAMATATGRSTHGLAH